MKGKSIFIFKKIYIVVVEIIAFLCLTGIAFSQNKPIFGIYGENYEVALYQSSSTAKFINVDSFGYKFITGKTGEAIEIKDKNIDANRILSDFNAKLIKVERFSEGVNYYAFSEKIKYVKEIDGEKINLQIFVGNSKIKVGSPLIFGSY